MLLRWFCCRFGQFYQVGMKTLEKASCLGNNYTALHSALHCTGIPNLPQSPDTRQNSHGGISDFRISGQSLIRRNCHNSRTCHDIDMKRWPVTKLDKKNKTTSKKFDVDVSSENCDVIVIFPIYSQFRAIRKPDSGRIVCKF